MNDKCGLLSRVREVSNWLMHTQVFSFLQGSKVSVACLQINNDTLALLIAF
jgi:hypothetical protein